MKIHTFHLVVLVMLASILACNTSKSTLILPQEEGFLDIQQIFFDERFPNIVVAKDGALIATWGREDYRVRRSTDGGKTWEAAITITNPGFQGGGTIVDEVSEDVLVFVEDGHPIAPLTVYRSKDHGMTWKAEKITMLPNSLGHIPSMHMNEHGITLSKGKYAGRLIRPSRYYGGGNDPVFYDDHYTNAIYSDDGGVTWQASEPFPANGTGEAAIVELSDGSLYYNSRRHKSTDGQDPRRRYRARSIDGGNTWIDISIITDLPDGAQDRDYGLMGGLTKFRHKKQDILLFSNIESSNGRKQGTIWASFDSGKTWPVKRLIEPGSFAYSSMTVGRKGTPSEGIIYLFYESDGGGKVARFNLPWLMAGHNLTDFIPK